ncbi:MAG: HlyD family type I secretion periplasmic adaptor subunit [Burkholderiaceae bacterium]
MTVSSRPTRKTDREFMDSVRAAHLVDDMPFVNWALYLMIGFVVVVIAWSSLARVDIVSKAQGRVVPDGHEQVIASLEGGILHELAVHEGMLVSAGQMVAQLDPTRMAAMQEEGQSQFLALRAIQVRLEAEINNLKPQFGPEFEQSPDIVRDEIRQYQARRRLLLDATAAIDRSLSSLESEIKVGRKLAAQGLMSSVELIRLERQASDLQRQQQERINQYRQQASEQLNKVRRDIAQLDGQMVMRNDALRRTQLRSPIRGLVKKIRVATVGGVVPPGTPIMEIVPIGDQIIVEARIKPGDIGFVREGQEATIKLTAYEFPVYGGLKGRVEYISPDALGENERQGNANTYYIARIHVQANTLMAGPTPLPVRPGMTGSVEISTGDRSVLSFLLRPVLKSREAFREQ